MVLNENQSIINEIKEKKLSYNHGEKKKERKDIKFT